MAGSRRPLIGIALGRDRAVAVVQGGKTGPVVHATGDFFQDPARVGEELRRAFRELKEGLESAGAGRTDGARVHIALLPPLADTRLLPFPPMARGEVQAVLTRDAARYFLGPSHPRIVGVSLVDRRGNGPASGGEPTRVLAAAAPLSLLEHALAALEQAGWRPGSFSSAHGDWLQAANRLKGSPVDAVVAMVGGAAHLLRLAGGRPEKLRQIAEYDPDLLAEALGPGPGRVVAFTSPQRAGGLQASLGENGWSVLRDPDGWADAMEGAAARAGTGDLRLEPPSLLQENRARRRRTAVAMMAGAAVLLVASAAVTLWGARRELHALQERRAAIQAEVVPLIQARDSVDALTERARALQAVADSAPLWSRSLVELSAVLPDDTYLTSFYASGDTLELEAAGTGAGEAIQLLREAGLFEDLRLQGVVEREMEGGETVREFFTLQGRLPSGQEGGGS